LPDEYVPSTYWTVTESPATAFGPLPTMRSVHSNSVGGVPEGTITVGAVPDVPTGDWSCFGICGVVVEPVSHAVKEDPVVVVVVAEVPDELPHAERPRAPTTMAQAKEDDDRVRRMEMKGSGHIERAQKVEQTPVPQSQKDQVTSLP
jgi:hypothetical protein